MLDASLSGPLPGDPIVDEWFPVATAADVAPGSLHPFTLLGRRMLLISDAEGQVSVVGDTCSHRGAQLSLGTFDGHRLQCPYHGWQFAADGTCAFRPAHPTTPIPSNCSLTRVHCRLAYGLWWACLGASPREVPSYVAYEAYPGLTVTLGPKHMDACGPRIVENFLDVAHFPFVHAGYLGVVEHAEYRDHDVLVEDGELLARNVMVWQPAPGPTATAGGDVRYEYGVSHPYAARLTKIPSEHDGGELAAFSILIVVSPETERSVRVWMLTTICDPDGDLDSYDSFNQIIFGQDIVTVESQLPKRLPLDPRAEVHQRADRMSLAYRRWLIERGTGFGTSAADHVAAEGSRAERLASATSSYDEGAAS